MAVDSPMTELDVSGLVAALADERMLEPEQYEEFTGAMLPICQDVHILAMELVYRGWLTPFQAEHILAGQTDALFLGSYILLEQIGEGGGGRVFRARNWKLNRIVAIKLIGAEQARNPAMVARFQREIRALGRIRHPNIVMAIDADFQPGSIYFAMEFFEGTDLRRHVGENGPLAIADACRYMMQTADALQHAHEYGLIHRDIKPSNIFLTEPDRVIKLLDLGLSRCEVPVDDSVFKQLTRAGALIGTPDFMSPEQVKDSRGTDIRSDLYSLGCTFYYLLTGVAPFQHLAALVDKIYAQCETEPAPLEELRAGIPPEIANIIRKLMAKRRRDRFQTPAELAAVLQLLLDNPIPLLPDTMLEVKSLTLIEGPALPPCGRDEARTVLLSHSEIELLRRPIAHDRAQPKRKVASGNLRLRASHFVIATLVAVLALLMIRHTGVAPTRDRQDPPRQERPTIEPEDLAGEKEGARSTADHVAGMGEVSDGD